MSLETFKIALDYGRNPTVPAHEKTIVLYAATSAIFDANNGSMWVSGDEMHNIIASLQMEYPNIDWPHLRAAFEKFQASTGIRVQLGHDPDAPTPDPFGRPSQERHAYVVCAADLPGGDEQRGYVYLVRADDRYKIGITRDLRQRLRQLGKQSPYPLEVIHYIKTATPEVHESTMHQRFEDNRVHGEWFVFDGADIPNVIDAMNACIDVKWRRDGRDLAHEQGKAVL